MEARGFFVSRRLPIFFNPDDGHDGSSRITVLILLWLAVSGIVVFRLTRRPRAWFAEPAPHVSWGPIRDHRLRTSDGQDIGAWFIVGEGGPRCSASSAAARQQGEPR